MTNITMLLSALVMSAAVMIVCRATPVQPPFADESQDTNEIGPEEDWKLYNQIAKIRLSDDDEAAADEEKTKRLMKEIKEFTQLVSTVAAATPDESTTLDESTTPDDRAETETETERDSASSDWFTSTWRAQLNRNDDGQMSWQRAAAQENGADDGGDEDVSDVEEIIKKIRKDLKRLYNKIKEVVKVVKNWVNSKRRGSSAMREYDGPFPMSVSASESDGVFVIAEPLVGDTDKSNKYTVPIFAD